MFYADTRGNDTQVIELWEWIWIRLKVVRFISRNFFQKIEDVQNITDYYFFLNLLIWSIKFFAQFIILNLPVATPISTISIDSIL